MTHEAPLVAAAAADAEFLPAYYENAYAEAGAVIATEPEQEPTAGEVTPEEKEALFRQLVSEYGRALHYFVLRRVGNETDAADIAQQAFTEAALSLKTFRGEACVSTWIFGIANNLTRNHLNRSPSRRHVFESSEVLESFEAPDTDPSELLARRQSMEMVSRALDTLPAPMAQALMLVSIEGASFGAGAYLHEQMLALARPSHRYAIVDGHRVAGWDDTGLHRLRLLARDLAARGTVLAACSIDARAAHVLGDCVRIFPDLDRALEWAEDEILVHRPEQSLAGAAFTGMLGEIGTGLAPAARRSLEALTRRVDVAPGAMVFSEGDRDHDLLILLSGRITIATDWPASRGVRLATIDCGMAFGEMAFITGAGRTAFAGAGDSSATLLRLAREDFEEWAKQHTHDSLVFMGNLAQVASRRLASTTRQLLAVLQ